MVSSFPHGRSRNPIQWVVPRTQATYDKMLKEIPKVPGSGVRHLRQVMANCQPIMAGYIKSYKFYMNLFETVSNYMKFYSVVFQILFLGCFDPKIFLQRSCPHFEPRPGWSRPPWSVSVWRWTAPWRVRPSDTWRTRGPGAAGRLWLGVSFLVWTCVDFPLVGISLSDDYKSISAYQQFIIRLHQ